MPDDLLNQAQTAAPYAGGGVLGALITVITGLKLFATTKDVDLAKSDLRAEFAEKYAHKDELSKMGDDLTYIRQRIDQIVDKK